MNKFTAMIAILIATGFAAFAPPALADQDGLQQSAPPHRPIPVQVSQHQALQRLAALPGNKQLADVRASYSPEHAREMSEIGVYATQAIVPTSILIALIAAAPL